MNQETEKTTDIKTRVLGTIGAGSVPMRSKLYFTAELALFALVSVAIGVITVFIVSVIAFSIRIQGHETLLGFGPQGWEAFLRFFPWHLLVIDVLLIIALQALIRKFRFGYTVPVLYLIGGLLAVTIVVGVGLDRTQFPGRFHGMPPVGRMYEHAQRQMPPGSGICRCKIVAIENNELTVEDVRSGTTTLRVILPPHGRHATTTNLRVGDSVFIAGEEKDGVITAFGVRKEGQQRHHQ